MCLFGQGGISDSSVRNGGVECSENVIPKGVMIYQSMYEYKAEPRLTGPRFTGPRFIAYRFSRFLSPVLRQILGLFEKFPRIFVVFF